MTVADIRMPFWSMVAFMVKWAVASIPAVLILIVLTAVFWGSAIALVASLGGILQRTRTSPVITQAPLPNSDGQPAGQPGAEETAYLGQVEIRNVRVGRDVLDEEAAFGELKNLGGRTLKEVEITLYCLGKDGRPVFEKTQQPVSDSPFNTNGPLKAGYSRPFGVKLDDAPSDWARKVDVKVTKVAFQ